KRVEKIITAKKKKIIGWDEILEGGLAPEATVMSWRGEAGGIKAAQMHHDVVMTPGTPLYFDHYQAGPEGEPPSIGGFNTLKMVYDYNPIPKELSVEEAKYVLGAQANVWTEFIATVKQLEYMVLPRMLAIGEVNWSPVESRNWTNFYERLQYHFRGFDQKGYNYSPGNYTVSIKPDSENGKLQVALFSEIPNSDIYYTLDGTDPNLESKKYEHPIAIESSGVLKAITSVNGVVMGAKPAQQNFSISKAVGRNVDYVNPVSSYYMADGPNTLTDGVRGTPAVGKYWHGFSGKDIIATIDLGKETDVHSIAIGCLQNYSDWIILPSSVKFETSLDGKDFTEVGVVKNTIPVSEKHVIKDFIAEFPLQKARYIRVTAKNYGLLPKEHLGAGNPSWIFADEIVVE
ncbi:MAG: family 20 glycosylhydrolase, partial [Ginsengibacter sp.]